MPLSDVENPLKFSFTKPNEGDMRLYFKKEIGIAFPINQHALCEKPYNHNDNRWNCTILGLGLVQR